MKAFTRQLGARSGIQLNPLIDQTGDRFVAGNSDQVFATAGRFERGRIDKAFRVNRGNQTRMLGATSSTLVSRLNECGVQAYESFQNGAYEGVFARLVPAAAVLSLLLVKADTVEANVWTVGTEIGTNMISIKHLECFNDGIYAEINAVKAFDTDGTTPVASKWVKLRLKDAKTKAVIFECEGSLDPAAKNEFGNSTYLPSVVSALTDDVEVAVAASASVPVTCVFYGKDGTGADKFIGKQLAYFAEGGTSYAPTDYDAVCTRLKYTEHDFGYISAGGSQAVALLSKLIALGKDINTQVLFDIPGNLSPAAAIAFYNQLGVDTHYAQAYWSPIISDDPVNGGKDYIGTAGVNVGMRCARNARTDANGIPPKNFVVAGKQWPLSRTGMVQKYFPTEQELDDLAEARINPVLFEKFNTGGQFIFTDSLTTAKTEGDRKLIAVADMSSDVDERVTRKMKELLQLPMEVAIKKASDFLTEYFGALQTAGWLIPTKELDGAAFAFTVTRNANRPADRMDTNYWLKYDGTVRAIYVQQTISK